MTKRNVEHIYVMFIFKHYFALMNVKDIMFKLKYFLKYVYNDLIGKKFQKYLLPYTLHVPSPNLVKVHKKFKHGL